MCSSELIGKFADVHLLLRQIGGNNFSGLKYSFTMVHSHFRSLSACLLFVVDCAFCYV